MKVLRILRCFFIIYLIFIILLSVAGVIVPLLGDSSMNIQNQAWELLDSVNYFPILGLVFPYEIMNFIENVKASVSFVDFFHIFIISLYFINQVTVVAFLIYMIKFLRINDIKDIFKSRNVENFKNGMIAIFVSMGASIIIFFSFLYQERNALASVLLFFTPTSVLGLIFSTLAGLSIISIYSILKKGKEVKEDSDLTI